MRFSIPVLTVLIILVVGQGTVVPAQSDAGSPAVRDALKAGRALCKVISPTDAGATRSNQAGLYLPKAAWRFFTIKAPVEEENHRSPVEITWPDSRRTEAIVSWYGKGSRSEFRLTRLQPSLDHTMVGDLLVLIPHGDGRLLAHLLETEAEAAEFCTALGIAEGLDWGVYDQIPDTTEAPGSIAEWAEQEAKKHDIFPTGQAMAGLARQAVQDCTPALLTKSADDRLMAWIDAEYAIYRAIERRLCDAQVKQAFTNVEDFLAAAATIMNRRKSRAGHSLEAHVEYLLQDAGIQFEAQAVIDGKVRPDMLFPGKAAYENPAHPVEELVVLGLKTTCRDRWRQVLNEGKRLPLKHLLTLQPAMSRAQLTEMHEARLQLIVPAQFHRGYEEPEGYEVWSVEQFVTEMKRRFPGS